MQHVIQDRRSALTFFSYDIVITSILENNHTGDIADDNNS